ncbi:MAG TPA: alpha/beta hydrolase domain-containing protein [Chloroflexota bacterium]|nr:alpha/beta hydrolase domain-containing protein [Chloroflexota bacterium]
MTRLVVVGLALVIGSGMWGSVRPASGTLAASVAQVAGITQMVIERIESPTFEGRAFGDVGRYEKLVGRAFGEVDPGDPLNAGIVNIERAPRNARGMVEYDVDVYILRPIDAQRSNKTILYEVVNRGNKGLRFNVGAGAGNDPTAAADAGDGLAMRLGYTLVWSGWQADTGPGSGRLTARFPVATNPDGSAIKGWIRSELIFEKPAFSVPVSFDRELRDVRPYPTVEESMAAGRLSRRSGPDASSELLPRESWSFARCDDGVTMTPSVTDVCLPTGFSPNFIYDLVYEARDPIVMGLGFAATRDVISFLRYESSEANPLVQRAGVAAGSGVQWAIGFGSSQSGRFLKDLIYQGFNQDTAGRRVFDGAIPHISGSRRTFTNYEFAMPGRFSTGVEGHHYPGDGFPFTYETSTDPISGQTDGVLARCRAQGVCPKIMHWDSGTEAWQARNSLVVTDPLGEVDVPIPDNVRLYYFASTQHGPAATPARGICQQLSNPLSYQETQRALLAALQGWVSTGNEPPPSQFPRLGDGTLVSPLPQAAQGFPAIPGVRYNGKLNHLFVNDQSVQPPRHVPGTEYTVLVPRVDGDGNEIGGIRSMSLQAALGTHSGWNLRAAGFMEDEACYLTGSYIPLASTRAERLAAGDPRASLEERYGSQEAYVEAVSAAARNLVVGRYLLAEDAERAVKAAQSARLALRADPSQLWGALTRVVSSE